MKIVTLNNKSYLVADATATELVNAMEFSGKDLNMRIVADYLKNENLNTLTNVTFGNQVFTARDLTPLEDGYVALAATAMQQAKLTALSKVENQSFDDLLHMGK